MMFSIQSILDRLPSRILSACILGVVFGAGVAQADDDAPPASAQVVGERADAPKSERAQPAVGEEDVTSFEETGIRSFFIIESAVELVESANQERNLRSEPALAVSLITGKIRGGVVVQPNESLSVGDVVLRGIIQNQGERAISFRNVDTDEFIELLPGETMVVVAAISCSVTCNSGYFACCWELPSDVRCKCKVNGAPYPETCDNGGPGSSACSISAAQ